MAQLLAFDNDIVKLIVGSERREFFVHASVLESSSPVFSAAFKANTWKESHERVMQLPDDDAECLHLLLHFANTHRFPKLVLHFDTGTDGLVHRKEYERLMKLYCLGEKYQMLGLKNAVVDAIVKKHKTHATSGKKWIPSGGAVTMMYEGTMAGSMGRSLVVDLIIGRLLGDRFRNASYPAEFIMDVTAKMLDDRRDGKNGIRVIRSCSYHEGEAA